MFVVRTFTWPPVNERARTLTPKPATPEAVLEVIKASLRPGQRVFLGVTDVLSPRIETPEEIRKTIRDTRKKGERSPS